MPGLRTVAGEPPAEPEQAGLPVQLFVHLHPEAGEVEFVPEQAAEPQQRSVQECNKFKVLINNNPSNINISNFLTKLILLHTT